MSTTLSSIAGLMHARGPLWVHGVCHIVVFAGYDVAHDQVVVHDPWPVHTGSRQWRSFSGWFLAGGAPGSQARSAGVQTSFLYHP